jgi:hypothetical protein
MDPDRSDCADAQAGLDPCLSQTNYVGFVVTRLILIHRSLLKSMKFLQNMSNFIKRMNKLCTGNCVPYYRSSKVICFPLKIASFNDTIYSYFDHRKSKHVYVVMINMFDIKFEHTYSISYKVVIFWQVDTSI